MDFHTALHQIFIFSEFVFPVFLAYLSKNDVFNATAAVFKNGNF